MIWWIIGLLALEIIIGVMLEIRILSKQDRNEARRYIDTLATNWSRVEAQMVANGDDCFMCWQAQALVNLAMLTNGWEFANEIALRIGMITDEQFKRCER
ncbi:MAG: hypothetical protein IKE23_12960 [Exiguobacterium sp.]|nr:hypothetical protein [Exiguobacterium sp.]